MSETRNFFEASYWIGRKEKLSDYEVGQDLESCEEIIVDLRKRPAEGGWLAHDCYEDATSAFLDTDIALEALQKKKQRYLDELERRKK